MLTISAGGITFQESKVLSGGNDLMVFETGTSVVEYNVSDPADPSYRIWKDWPCKRIMALSVLYDALRDDHTTFSGHLLRCQIP